MPTRAFVELALVVAGGSAPQGVERVSTGLYAMSLDAHGEGLAHLRSAQVLVDAWRSTTP